MRWFRAFMPKEDQFFDLLKRGAESLSNPS